MFARNHVKHTQRSIQLSTTPSLSLSPPRSGWHARGGPLTVSSQVFETPLARAFVAAGQYFGYHATDPNGAQQTGMLR